MSILKKSLVKVHIFAHKFQQTSQIFLKIKFSLKLVKKIKSTAFRSIAIQAATISQLQTWVDDDFCQAVEKVFTAKGKVIVTGIGKSALIGQKIVGTLNSTGTTAIFMHAADAIHGDLGVIGPEDIVMVISKSGDTPEIKALVPLLKHRNVTLLGMVSNRNSYLAVHSDHILNSYIDQEADLHNLIPTSSTTAALVLGDAFAVCLAELRGFSPEDFARLHPGGTLGKKLHLRVSDLYPSNPLPAVPLGANLREIIMEMTSKCLGATAVLDELGQLRGIITDGDLRRTLSRNFSDELFSCTAEQIMTPNPISVNEDVEAIRALEIMQTKSISQLLITDGKNLKGILHIHDLVREGLG